MTILNFLIRIVHGLLCSFLLVLGRLNLEEEFLIISQLALRIMAGAEVVGLDLNKRRRNPAALLGSHVAACAELASGRGIDGAGDISFEDDPLLISRAFLSRGDGGQKSHSIGMTRIIEYGLLVSKLNYIAQIHNGYAVGDELNDRKVMGYEHVCKLLLLLELLKQVDYLGLNGNVKSGYALVADNELGLNGKRTGYADTLTLTAGELMGITVQHVLLQTALLHRFNDIGTQPRRTVLEEVMRYKTFLNYLADREAGIQRGIGILEDYLQVFTQTAHLLVFQAGKVNAVIAHCLILLELRIVLILCPDAVKLFLKLGNLGIDGL